MSLEEILGPGHKVLRLRGAQERGTGSEETLVGLERMEQTGIWGVEGSVEEE
jgi:hypothetical protein